MRRACKLCLSTFEPTTGYHSLGICFGCAKSITHEFIMAHTGEPDPRFAPTSVIEEYERNRTARSKKAKISQTLRKAVFERDGYRCQECGGHVDLEADHVFPESKGGKTDLGNLRTLCKVCNTMKGAGVPA